MSNWISVLDKRPDIDTFVVYSLSGEIETLEKSRGFITPEYNTFEDWGDGSYICGFAKWGGRPVCFTHWMPPPEPPKGVLK